MSRVPLSAAARMRRFSDMRPPSHEIRPRSAETALQQICCEMTSIRI